MNAEVATISPLAAYIGSFLDNAPPFWVLLIIAVVVHWFVLLLPTLAIMAYMERKLSADIQMRIGPNRVSPFGLIQSVADGIKLLFKEDGAPRTRDSLLFKWGTAVATVCLVVAIGNIPLGQNLALTNLDSGTGWIIASMVLSNLCLFWAGYSAESPWSVISSFRILSMVSIYLVPISLSLLPPILIAGSPSIDLIVRSQGGAPWKWNAFHDPGSFFSFLALFVGLLIWQGEDPFKISTARGDIAGGLESEYSGVRKGMLAFLRYTSSFLACALIVSVYLGGWQTPFNLDSFGRASNLVECLGFLVKVFFLVLISIWIRWSLPLMRIDQVISLSWRLLVPASIGSAFVTSIWMVVFHGKGFGDFL